MIKYVRSRKLFIIAGLMAFASCSNIASLDITSVRTADYDTFLNQHLKREKIFLRLREMSSGKALMVTQKLAELQEKVVPGFGQVPVSGTTTFVVSLEMPDWSRFNILDFKFYWGDASSKSVKEIQDGQLIQTLYPFGYPHDRVFLVQFASEKKTGDLVIQTSQGQFKFSFGEE